ncbi:helix-turn-helix transcriptional regulator [Ekhidna sp.]|uniref:PadR family transcriptional regulator n=1 Tax=Ekhidna sp. TaxID=2608089 RepID=UPI003299F577
MGALEEMVILIAAAMKEEAYAVSIAREYTRRTSQEISIPAIHTVLKRLETKGFVRSTESAPTSERGGRKKRLYEITTSGYSLASELRNQREELWSLIPKMSV